MAWKFRGNVVTVEGAFLAISMVKRHSAMMQVNTVYMDLATQAFMNK